MISVSSKGNFSSLEKYLKNGKKSYSNMKKIEAYCEEVVQALSEATPINTGTTANSWYYKIINDNGVLDIQFCNSNIQNGVSVAILLQYGHATKNGGLVYGIDYINPVINNYVKKISDYAWKEVNK